MLRRIGTTLDGILARHQGRAVRTDVNRPGAEDVKAAAGESRQDLYESVGGSTEVASVPATFSIIEPTVTQTVTFAVPAGTYTSATWGFRGSADNTQNYVEEVETAGPDVVNNDPGHSSGPFDFTVSASANQLADINAAAGGNLSVDMNVNTDPGLPGWTIDIDEFTLTLDTGAGQVYEVFILGVHPMDGHTDTTQRYIP